MSARLERALISVSNKDGLAEFARALQQADVEIYSTGGTATFLREAGVTVYDVATYTQFPEMMDGRLKTLHPKIFGGILCRWNHAADREALEQFQIKSFGLVVVNLYPFEETVAQPATTWDQAIEKIDIGGPSLVRAAAKNHAFVSVATSPTQYSEILSAIQKSGETSIELRRRLAAAAFEHTARYDRAIANYFAQQVPAVSETITEPAEPKTIFPSAWVLNLRRQAVLRYGENPHQTAALYAYENESKGSNVVAALQQNGKELSYNNLLDADAALSIARALPDAGVSVVKHNNPCGAASASTVGDATRKAMEGDPVSAFGSILGYNRPVDAEAAEYLSTPGLFVEAIVAPSFSVEAIEILTTRPKWKQNVRLLSVGSLDSPPQAWHYRCVEGGMLIQQNDALPDPSEVWTVVTRAVPDEATRTELQFAWTVVRYVKSNAIVLSRDRMLVGVGAGQMSRVDSVQIAIRKAESRADGSVLASDAFFPFPDSIHEAARAGIRAVIQPGGSKRDSEVIDACNELGISMVFTGRRHFRH